MKTFPKKGTFVPTNDTDRITELERMAKELQAKDVLFEKLVQTVDALEERVKVLENTCRK